MKTSAVKTAVKTVAAVAAAAVLSAGLTGAAAPQKNGATKGQPQTFELTIVQTNDLHGHLEEVLTLPDGSEHENNVAKYSTLIQQIRAEEENMLVVDGGDVFLRGEFEQYQGALETEILKRIK